MSCGNPLKIIASVSRLLSCILVFGIMATAGTQEFDQPAPEESAEEERVPETGSELGFREDWAVFDQPEEPASSSPVEFNPYGRSLLELAVREQDREHLQGLGGQLGDGLVGVNLSSTIEMRVRIPDTLDAVFGLHADVGGIPLLRGGDAAGGVFPSYSRVTVSEASVVGTIRDFLCLKLGLFRPEFGNSFLGNPVYFLSRYAQRPETDVFPVLEAAVLYGNNAGTVRFIPAFPAGTDFFGLFRTGYPSNIVSFSSSHVLFTANLCAHLFLEFSPGKYPDRWGCGGELQIPVTDGIDLHGQILVSNGLPTYRTVLSAGAVTGIAPVPGSENTARVEGFIQANVSLPGGLLFSAGYGYNGRALSVQDTETLYRNLPTGSIPGGFLSTGLPDNPAPALRHRFLASFSIPNLADGIGIFLPVLIAIFPDPSTAMFPRLTFAVRDGMEFFVSGEIRTGGSGSVHGNSRSRYALSAGVETIF